MFCLAHVVLFGKLGLTYFLWGRGDKSPLWDRSFFNYKITRIIHSCQDHQDDLWNTACGNNQVNTCFEEQNIYPYNGENPRLIPQDNPTPSACTLRGTREGGREEWSSPSKITNSVLNKLPNHDPVFSTPGLLLWGDKAPRLLEQLINKIQVQLSALLIPQGTVKF